jgi:hypothetical protein
MRSRNRSVEAGVPIEYLIKLRDGYHELLAEAEVGLLPWAHAVRVHRIVWDVPTVTEEQWDAVAQTIRDACRLRASVVHVAIP